MAEITRKNHPMKHGAMEPKATVWLVEDNADTRRVLTRVLNRSARLTCPGSYSSCEEALQALHTQKPPDAILIDVGLPGMSGIEGLGHLKAMAPGTHMIVLTVFDDEEK